MLPWSEKLMFAFNWVVRQVCQPGTVAPYVPDFTRAFDHFCLHAGETPGGAQAWVKGRADVV